MLLFLGFFTYLLTCLFIYSPTNLPTYVIIFLFIIIIFSTNL